MLPVYRSLLRLYPSAYRCEYGDEMIAVFREVEAEAGKNGVVARSLLYAREAGGLLRGAFQEHVRAILISHSQLPFRSRRFPMRTEFRFPQATAWLMAIILALVVFVVEKAKTIQASLPSTRPRLVPVQPDHFAFLLTILFMLAITCGIAAIGWAILFALRRSGVHRLSDLHPSGTHSPSREQSA